MVVVQRLIHPPDVEELQLQCILPRSRIRQRSLFAIARVVVPLGQYSLIHAASALIGCFVVWNSIIRGLRTLRQDAELQCAARGRVERELRQGQIGMAFGLDIGQCARATQLGRVREQASPLGHGSEVEGVGGERA
jgi:hypothetical protein